jgi:hypothetical protein
MNHGETDLKQLLQSMSPGLHPGEYVFCTLAYTDIPAGLHPLASFREQEGWTVIVPRSQADESGLPYSFVAAWITLHVHSALEAVGLTAAVSRALADEGISCNLVAAYYHDHLFVPHQEAGRAMDILRRLSAASRT